MFFLIFLFAFSEQPDNESYAIVVFTADWCRYCGQLETSFQSNNVKKVVEEDYDNSLYFVDIEDEENKKFVQAYNAKNLPLPSTFLLRRINDAKGIILVKKVGYMPSATLANFLKNPARYNKKSRFRIDFSRCK